MEEKRRFACSFKSYFSVILKAEYRILHTKLQRRNQYGLPSDWIQKFAANPLYTNETCRKLL